MVVGTIYNMKKNDEGFKESIPHREFWIDLPSLVAVSSLPISSYSLPLEASNSLILALIGWMQVYMAKDNGARRGIFSIDAMISSFF